MTANIALVASYRFVAQFPSTAVLTAFKTDGRSKPQTHWSVKHCSSRAISKPETAQERRNLILGEYWMVRVDEDMMRGSSSWVGIWWGLAIGPD